MIGVYLHILEHEWVIAEPQNLAAGNGHIPEIDFPGSDIGKLLHVGIVGHFPIEICKYGRTLVVIRMFGVVDPEVFDCDPFRHITGVAEIVLPGIGSTDQTGTCRFAACRYENAIADQEFSLPGAAIVGTEIDKISSIDGAIFHSKGSAANGINSLVTEG